MIIHNFFGGKNQIFAFITAGLLFAGLFSCLVISGYWYSYYTYGVHADYTVLATYYCTLLCMVFSLLALVVLIFMVVSHFFLSVISESRLFSNIIVIVLTVFSIISVLTGLLCGVLGVMDIDPNDNYDWLDNPHFDPKCHSLLIYEFSRDMYYYARDHNDAKGFGTWMHKIVTKIYPDAKELISNISKEFDIKGKDLFISILQYAFENDDYVNITELTGSKLAAQIFGYENIHIEEFMDYTLAGFDSEDISYAAEYSNALCKTVGVPSIIFSILTIAGLVFLLIFGCCAKGDNDDASANEGL